MIFICTLYNHKAKKYNYFKEPAECVIFYIVHLYDEIIHSKKLTLKISKFLSKYFDKTYR